MTADPTDAAATTPKLTITHTAADGTLLEGTRKGDGAWETIKTAQAKYRIRGWRYMPSIRAIGVSHSRDRAPQLGLIDTTAEILREAGFTVDIQIDAAPRAMEDAEADRAERMDDRADALAAKAERKSREADARWAAAQEIAETIPAGQPILRDHHSARGHRRDLARMDGHMRKSLELEGEAKRAAHGADTAAAHMDLREAPGVTARRIETLEADRRRVQRGLDGHTTRHLDGSGRPVYVFEHKPAEGRYREQLEANAADLDEKIRYWKTILDEHRRAGRWNPYSPDTIKKGDTVGSWAGWREVVRVNKKTVTIRDTWGNPNVPADDPRQWFTRTIKYDAITGHRPAQPAEPEAVADLDADGTEAVAR